MKNLLFLIIVTLFCVACGSGKNDDAWTTLSNAVDSLYHGNYEAYINNVDSQDVAKITRDVFFLSLKQNYNILSDNDSLECIMDDINSDNDSALIKYRIVCNKQDTTFCTQKMILLDGKWKLKII